MEAKKRAEEMEDYALVLEKYRFRQYSEVMISCNEVISKEPSNHLLAKYYFLKALATGGLDSYSGQRDNYIAALEVVVNLFPDTEEFDKAEEMLKILRGDFESAPSEDVETTDDSPFVLDSEGDHYFVVLFTKGTASFNTVKSAIANFNSAMYGSASLKTSSNLIDREHHLVLVKTFKGQPEGEEYYQTFTRNEEIVGDINTENFDKMLITKKNYVTLFKEKNIEAYIEFFNENYLSD